MTTSETVKNLTAALESLHEILRPVKRNMENPNYRSRYADLAAVAAHCKRPLRKCRLLVMQTASSGFVDGAWQGDVTTRLVHVPSQEWMQSNLSIPCFDAQSLAKGITYGRRIAYQTIVGLVVESDDDDGNAANGERAEPTVPGAMDTTRVRIVAELSPSRRKGRPFYRFRGADGNIYGTFDADLRVSAKTYAEADITWKSDVNGTRIMADAKEVPADQQKPEAPL